MSRNKLLILLFGTVFLLTSLAAFIAYRSIPSIKVDNQLDFNTFKLSPLGSRLFLWRTGYWKQMKDIAIVYTDQISPSYILSNSSTGKEIMSMGIERDEGSGVVYLNYPKDSYEEIKNQEGWFDRDVYFGICVLMEFKQLGNDGCRDKALEYQNWTKNNKLPGVVSGFRDSLFGWQLIGQAYAQYCSGILPCGIELRSCTCSSDGSSCSTHGEVCGVAGIGLGTCICSTTCYLNQGPTIDCSGVNPTTQTYCQQRGTHECASGCTNIPQFSCTWNSGTTSPPPNPTDPTPTSSPNDPPPPPPTNPPDEPWDSYGKTMISVFYDADGNGRRDVSTDYIISDSSAVNIVGIDASGQARTISYPNNWAASSDGNRSEHMTSERQGENCNTCGAYSCENGGSRGCKARGDDVVWNRFPGSQAVSYYRPYIGPPNTCNRAVTYRATANPGWVVTGIQYYRGDGNWTSEARNSVTINQDAEDVHNCSEYYIVTTPILIGIRPNQPPACTLDGPTTGLPNQTLTYTINAVDYENRLQSTAMYSSPTSNMSWTQQCSRSSSGNCTYTCPAAGGQFYLTCNAYDLDGGKCSGNPWCEWPPNPPSTLTCGYNVADDGLTGWNDCGPYDVITVNCLTPTPLPSATPTPTPYLEAYSRNQGGAAQSISQFRYRSYQAYSLNWETNHTSASPVSSYVTPAAAPVTSTRRGVNACWNPTLLVNLGVTPIQTAPAPTGLVRAITTESATQVCRQVDWPSWSFNGTATSNRRQAVYVFATPTPTPTPPVVLSGTVYVGEGSSVGGYCTATSTSGTLSGSTVRMSYDAGGSLSTTTTSTGAYSLSPITYNAAGYLSLDINTSEYACVCPPDINSTPGSCEYRLNPGPTASQTRNFFVTAVRDAWWQVFGGDIFAGGLSGTGGNISVSIPETMPTTTYLLNTFGNARAGIAIARNGSISLGTGRTITNNLRQETGAYNAASQYIVPIQEDYQYFARLFELQTSFDNFVGYHTLPVGPAPKPSSGTYYSDGNLILTQGWNVLANEKIVVFVNGNLTINPDVTPINNNPSNGMKVAPGGFLAFIVNGSILINETKGLSATSTTPWIEGVYIANNTFSTGGTNSRTSPNPKFIGAGTFVGWNKNNSGQGIQLGRNFGNVNNNSYPSEMFIYRPDLLFNAPPEFRRSTYEWKEALPGSVPTPTPGTAPPPPPATATPTNTPTPSPTLTLEAATPVPAPTPNCTGMCRAGTACGIGESIDFYRTCNPGYVCCVGGTAF